MLPEMTRIGQLLDLWEEARERGEVIAPEELCATCPELLGMVREQIAALESVDERLRTTYEPQELIVASAESEDIVLGTDTVTMKCEITRPKFHARGGLGAVYVAEDSQMHREVALKFIHHRLVHDEDSRKDFQREAEITARLEHPGVVPLYAMGELDNGRLFYAMRFIHGETLDAAIKRYHQDLSGKTSADSDRTAKSLGFRDLLTRFLSVCRTIAYAHSPGIVHRDIKPLNVMLGRFGETIVLDWGLAASVTRTPGASPARACQTSASFAGTLPYMSPSQTSGLAPSPADDVYALGVMLYKIITSSLPFCGDSSEQIRQQILQGRLVRPRTLKPQLPLALEAICLKAMAFQPSDRYDSALELAADVERYLADERVLAFAEPPLLRLTRWARRHRAAAMSSVIGLGAIAVLTLIAAIGLGSLAAREHNARQRAVESQRELKLARGHILRTSAKFAARTIEQEIELRWRILEAEANSERLRAMVQKINAAPGDPSLWQPVQAWLDQRAKIQDQAVVSSSWFVNSRDGKQVARSPVSSSIGESFAHRSYFNGHDHDLDPSEVQEPAPHGKPTHMSSVFQSVATDTLMVAFSVPIWDQPPEVITRKPIGIIAMAVEIGKFELPPAAMIVDLRNDYLTRNPQPGLVLHHHKLGHRTRMELPPRLGASDLTRALEIRRMRLLTSDDTDTLLPNFIDPVVAEAQPTLAAIEPIIIRGRPEHEIADTGWTVIVTGSE